MQPKSIMIYIFATHPHFSCFRLPILPICRPTLMGIARRFLRSLSGHVAKNVPSARFLNAHVRFSSSAGTVIYQYDQDVSKFNGNRSAGSRLLSRHLACLHPPLAVAGSGSIPITRSEKRQVTGYSGDLPFGAGEGNRTLIASLGSWSSATELHPQ